MIFRRSDALIGACLFCASCSGRSSGPPESPSSASGPTASISSADLAHADAGKESPPAHEVTDSGATTDRSTGPSREPGRTPADIRAIVVAHREEVRACYLQAVALRPEVSGAFVALWRIDPTGTVSDVSVEDSGGQPVEAGLTRCVGNVIRSMSFASSKAGFETRARYPFGFHAPRRAQNE
jgi:hypothetical protein